MNNKLYNSINNKFDHYIVKCAAIANCKAIR